MTEPRNLSNLSRILVATDLSPRAEIAIARAAQVAEEHGAKLTILHVLTQPVGDKTRKRKIVVAVDKDLRRKVLELSPQLERKLSVEVATGTAFVEIIRRAREHAADMLLVGAHGAEFNKNWLTGTIAEKIARKADRPVLVVKRPVRGPYRRVLIATDFSDQSRQALEFSLRLAPGAEIHVLHAYQEIEGQLWRGGFAKAEILRYRHKLAQKSRAQMNNLIRRLASDREPVVRLIRCGRAPHVIISVAQGLRPDLVSVGSAGRTGLPYILLGSVAEHVLREVACDVLIARSTSSGFKLP